jgi:hypothetical protein
VSVEVPASGPWSSPSLDLVKEFIEHSVHGYSLVVARANVTILVEPMPNCTRIRVKLRHCHDSMCQ